MGVCEVEKCDGSPRGLSTRGWTQGRHLAAMPGTCVAGKRRSWVARAPEERGLYV